MKKVLSLIFLFLFSVSTLLFFESSFANAGLGDAFGSIQETVGNKAGYKTSGQAELPDIISNVISIVLSLLGVIFVGLLIYSGITWMTAGGQEEKVTQAKGTLKQAIIGLIVVLGAYALSYFIINALGALTN